MDDAKEQGGDIKDSDYWYQVTDIPPAICAAFLNRLVIPERIMLKDIPEGKRLKDPEGLTYKETEGKVFASLFMQEELFTWVFARKARNNYGLHAVCQQLITGESLPRTYKLPTA